MFACDSGDQTGECRAHGNLGSAFFSKGNYREALTNHRHQLVLAMKLKDREVGRLFNRPISESALHGFLKKMQLCLEALSACFALLRIFKLCNFFSQPLTCLFLMEMVCFVRYSMCVQVARGLLGTCLPLPRLEETIHMTEQVLLPLSLPTAHSLQVKTC